MRVRNVEQLGIVMHCFVSWLPPGVLLQAEIYPYGQSLPLPIHAET